MRKTFLLLFLLKFSVITAQSNDTCETVEIFKDILLQNKIKSDSISVIHNNEPYIFIQRKKGYCLSSKERLEYQFGDVKIVMW
ncbi:MAG: hypothetical protein ACPG6V_03700 [Flavobacteriales bacterium]